MSRNRNLLFLQPAHHFGIFVSGLASELTTFTQFKGGNMPAKFINQRGQITAKPSLFYSVHHFLLNLFHSVLLFLTTLFNVSYRLSPVSPCSN